VSSHLMSEMALTADHLIVIGRGKLIAASSTQEFIERSSERSVLVRSPEADRLAGLIEAEGGKSRPGAAAEPGQAPALVITGLESPRVGELAASGGIVLHELTPQLASLEEAFMELTADSVEFGPAGPGSAETGPASTNHVPSAEGSPR